MHRATVAAQLAVWSDDSMCECCAAVIRAHDAVQSPHETKTIWSHFFGVMNSIPLFCNKKKRKKENPKVLQKLPHLHPVVHVSHHCLDLWAVVAVLHPHHQHGLCARGPLHHLLHALPPSLLPILPPGSQHQYHRDNDENSHQQPHQRPHNSHHTLLLVLRVQLAGFQPVGEQLIWRPRPTFGAVQSDVHYIRATVVFHPDILSHLGDFTAGRPPGAKTFTAGLGRGKVAACGGQRVVLQAALSNASVCILFRADRVNGVDVPLPACSNLKDNKNMHFLKILIQI